MFRQFSKLTFIFGLLLSVASTTIFSEEKEVNLNALFGQQDEFLDIDEAFALNLDIFDNEIIVNWQIAPTYYLYQHRLKINTRQVELSSINLPEGKHKNDEYFGDVEIYQKLLQLGLPIKKGESVFGIKVDYQGCAEAGLCYPPTSRYFQIDSASKSALPISSKEFNALSSELKTEWSAPPLKTSLTSPITVDSKSIQKKTLNTQKSITQTKALPQSEKEELLSLLTDSSLIVGFFTLVFAGILLAFTPCVFPMMPIISSIIAGQGNSITTSKAFLLSLTYTQAMAIPYVILGILVSFFGAQVTSVLQSPIAISIASVIFVILAIGMFGFFEIQLPSGLQNKLNSVSQNQKGGTYIGAGIMGFISALVVSPCVTIPLIAVLTYIAQQQDIVKGMIYLYGLAVGMGIPLIILGVGGGKLLPRAGGWMNAVKSMFGVMMLAVALFIAKHLIPTQINLLLWGTLFIVTATYMGALKTVENGWPTLWKGVGIVLLIIGASYIVGAAMGNQSLLNPLHNQTTQIQSTPLSSSTQIEKNNKSVHDGFILIKSSEDLDNYLKKAKEENKTVMLDFFAEYCTACFEFAKLTFPDPAVQKALSNTILLQADVTAGDELDLALMNRFKIFGLPSILFFDKNGKELSSLRAEGFEDAETFASRIETAFE